MCHFIPPSLFSLHCPHSPFFYPHDLVFNMDAENSSTTAQFMSLANPFNHILCRTVARNLQCRLTIVYLSCLNNYFVTTQQRIYSQNAETMRKRTRNGVCQGPGRLNNSSIDSNERNRHTPNPIRAGFASR